MSPLSRDAGQAGGGHELAAHRDEWFWFLLLGVAMALAGIIAISYSCVATVLTVTLFGVLLLACGIAELISAFWSVRWSGFLLTMLIAVLYIVFGVMIVNHPVQMSAGFTLLMAAFFIVTGLFRVIAALTLRFPNWGWPLLNGVITTILGLLIYRGWPASSLFIIGLFVGIELLFNGLAWIMLSLDVRRIEHETA